MKWRKRSSARWRWGGPSVLAALALIAVISAACSSPPPSRSIASLPNRGGSTTTTTPTLSKAQQIALDDQHMVDFARCMRSHGVNQSDPVPDPIAGHAGLTMQVPSRTASNGAAFDACIHFLQASGAGNGGASGPAISAAQLAARTSYARCMRSHDIAMLDPDQYGDLGLGNVPGINNGFGRYSPQFRAADSACRHLLPAGSHDDGSGP